MSTLAARNLPFRPRRTSHHERVRSLLLLNDAAQKINSILDLDTLLDKFVNEVVLDFACVEAVVLLKDDDGDRVRIAAVMGCTQSCKHDTFVIGKEGLVGAVAALGCTLYTPDVSLEPRYVACEPSTRSELDIPLVAHGSVIGVVSLQHAELDGFPPEQRELLEALAGHLAVAIENARLFKRERAEKDEARAIQQALFPKAAPEIANFIVQGDCLPALSVAGDWYDWIPLKDGRWGVVLADVSGKGMAAALLMSATRGILRSIAFSGDGPAQVLERVNHLLIEDLPPSKYITMVYTVLDPATRQLTFANAGHPWPLFINGEPRFLPTQSGLPLGVSQNSYDEHTIELSPGSSLLLYSDGITEAANPLGEEYGVERLSEHVHRSHPCAAACVLQDVRNFTGSGTLADDATVVMVRST